MSARAAYNALAREYDSSHVDSKDLAENATVARLLHNGGFLTGRILDVGCGTGFLLDLAGQLGWDLPDYLGVDVAEAMVDVAREKHPKARFLLADMHDLDGVAAGQFDNVVSLFGVMSYTDIPVSMLMEMQRALRSGGRIFAMFYSTRHVGRYSYLAGSRGFEIPRVLYTARKAQAVFDAADFDDVRVFGLSAFVDGLHQMPARLVGAYYRAEEQLLRAVPDMGKYIVVTARKR